MPSIAPPATTKRRTQSRALPWFGADTLVCEQYAARLADCRHVTVLMCGGLSVAALLVQTAGEVVCNDKHELAINFYEVISHPERRADLVHRLRSTPFHEHVLTAAQFYCKAIGPILRPDIEAAYQYFLTAWMGRSGKAGTKSEFESGLALRWDAGGGSSPLRLQTSVRSIDEVWGPICERCSFTCLDCWEILTHVKDDPKCGLYVDPPWFGVGDQYANRFQAHEHELLECSLAKFQQTKVVIRYGDNDAAREIYREWHVTKIRSRNQANGDVSELCITNFRGI